jgi:hypothetical protein
MNCARKRLLAAKGVVITMRGAIRLGEKLHGMKKAQTNCEGLEGGWLFISLTAMSQEKLAGNLGQLQLRGTRVTELAPLKDMPLISLDVGKTEVSDLSPLKDLKLTSLSCPETQVRDLTPLQNMKLTHLDITATPVTNLAPLQRMPLKRLRIDVELARRNAAILRSIPTLQTINGADPKIILK